MTRVVVCLALSVVFGASLGFLATRNIAAAQSPGWPDAPARAAPSRPASPPVRPLNASLDFKAGRSFIAANTPAEDKQDDAMSAAVFRLGSRVHRIEGRS